MKMNIAFWQDMQIQYIRVRGYKILGKSWGHLKVHIVWSTCYSTKLLIDLTSAFVLGLYPIHCNPCHFPLHIVVVRKKQSQGLKYSMEMDSLKLRNPCFWEAHTLVQAGCSVKGHNKTATGKGPLSSTSLIIPQETQQCTKYTRLELHTISL